MMLAKTQQIAVVHAAPKPGAVQLREKAIAEFGDDEVPSDAVA